MNFDINREIIYIKYSPPETSKSDGLDGYAAPRPASMAEPDFNTLLNFFRKICGELKSDEAHYSGDTLLNNNTHFFCFKSGAALFKIAPCPAAQNTPELYGYFFAAENVRTAWVYIGKLCYVLAGDSPRFGKSGKFSEEKLAGLDVNSLNTLHETYKTALSEMTAKLSERNYPENFVLSCLPDNFYPDGVKVYNSGFIPVKTNTKSTDVIVEFDDAALAGMVNGCKEPLRTAVIASVAADDTDDTPAEVKKGGFFRLFRKETPVVEVKGKPIRSWRYDFLGETMRRTESCDFIRLNEPLEYSPISDTFFAYNAIVAPEAKEAMLPIPPAARVYVPSSLKPLAPLPMPVPAPAPIPAAVQPIAPLPEPPAPMQPEPEPVVTAKPAITPIHPITHAMKPEPAKPASLEIEPVRKPSKPFKPKTDQPKPVHFGSVDMTAADVSETVNVPKPEPVAAVPMFDESEQPKPVLKKPEPVFVPPAPEPEPPKPEPPKPAPVELTPFIHKKPEPEPDFEFEDSGFEPIVATPISMSKLPPPPAPVTIDAPPVWSATTAEIVQSGDTSGEMDAVAVKPKSMNPALELYFKSQKK